MKKHLRRLFSPILNIFEKGDDNYSYKAQNRIVLIVMGALFWLLCAAVVFSSKYLEGYGYLFPAMVFFLVGFVGLLVGTLGSDKAVARIWFNR